MKMKWYAAHLIMYVQFKKHLQSHYPIWENIILIKARSDQEAFGKAEKPGRAEEGDCSGTFRWGGKPARWVFAGVRKLTSCVDPETRPNDGTEVSFLELEAGSKVEIEKLLEGEPVCVKVMDKIRVVTAER